MIRMVMASAFLVLPTAAFAQEALYKSYIEAANKALQAGEWKEVEKMAKLADKEAAGFKADDPRKNYSNNLLASAYRAQSRYAEAIELYKKGLANAEAMGANNIYIAFQAETFGNLYVNLGRTDLAEPLMRQSLKVFESQPKPANWLIALGLRGVGICLFMDGKHDEAEATFKQALKLLETEPNRQPQAGLALMWLAKVYISTDRAKEAEALTKQGLAIYVESKVGGTMLARGLFARAEALVATGKPTEAAKSYKEGLDLFTASGASVTDSPDLIPVLTAYAKLLRADKKVAEATKLEARAADLKVKLDKGREALPK